MSGQGENNQSIESLVRELEKFCESDALSLDALREKINQITPSSGAIQSSSFLHRACMNMRVTLEIVAFILDAFPELGCVRTIFFCPDGETTAYPLHLACCNKSCPASAIELLMKRNPSALSHLCIIDEGVKVCVYYDEYVEGLPLHYYLMRESNIDLSTIKMLVEAYPDALTIGDGETRITPIHTLVCNPTIGELCDTVQFLVETNPSSLRLTDEHNRVPLHVACRNKKMDSKIVRVLLDCWPECTRHRDVCGDLPIHNLCWDYPIQSLSKNEKSDETASLEILQLLVKMDPRSVMETNKNGRLPLHYAAEYKSPEFCKILVDSYPETLRIETTGGCLPIHRACCWGRVDTVKYMLELYPESIDMRTSSGYLPIHLAEKTEIIKCLLLQDPDGASKATTESRNLPLHLTCDRYNLDHNVVQLLFDAHPVAICTNNRNGNAPLEIIREWARRNSDNSKVISENFLETQMTYARKAQDIIAMHTLDSNGWLPLHHALHNKAPLGAIKLLEKGNPCALQVIDYQGLFPLHIACEFSTADIVQFLVELNDSCLDHCDSNKNYPLHHACREGNFGVVKYLLESRVPSVSERNGNNKLPIHLLCESVLGVVDRESPEYVEVIWRLILAYPETVLNFD